MQRKVINPTTVFNSLQYGFSQAMEVPEGRRIMLSGQVGVDAQEHTVGPGIAEQTAAALDNIEKVLAEVGGDLSHVIMLRLYIVESAREQQASLKGVAGRLSGRPVVLDQRGFELVPFRICSALALAPGVETTTVDPKRPATPFNAVLLVQLIDQRE